MRNEIRVFAPASVTNVGPGFDIMGFALDQPGDEIILRFTDKPGIIISKITGDNGKLLNDPSKNTAGLSLISLAEHLKIDRGIEIEIHKKMGIGSGLGSSAASAVASVFALNEILERPLSKPQLLQHALNGEQLTSGGVPHADNVSACLFGGFVIVRSLSPLDVISIPTQEELFCTVIYPHVEITTEEARKILPKQISLKDAVIQSGNLAALVAGLSQGNMDIIKRSLNDVISEPVRSKLIPGYGRIKTAAIEAGAIGANISGSGPSVFALSQTSDNAEVIGEAMKKVVSSYNINSDIYISKINQKGPRVL